MAALRGTISGDRTRANSDATSTRLADRRLTARADTWHTFGTIELERDGSGSVTVIQNGRPILRASFTAETAELPTVEVRTVGDPGMSAGILA